MTSMVLTVSTVTSPKSTEYVLNPVCTKSPKEVGTTLMTSALAGESWLTDSRAVAASMGSERNPQARMVRLP
jgi:hypothetical protein